MAYNLKRHRKALGLTQADLAEMIDRAIRTYQSYEDCSVIPPPEVLDHLAEIFKVNPVDLYIGHEVVTNHPKMSDFNSPEGLEMVAKRLAKEVVTALNSDASVSSVVSDIDRLVEKGTITVTQARIAKAFVTGDWGYLEGLSDELSRRAQAALKPL